MQYNKGADLWKKKIQLLWILKYGMNMMRTEILFIQDLTEDNVPVGIHRNV